MARTTTPPPLPKNVRRTPTGFIAKASIGRTQCRTKRFPADTPYKVMADWIGDTKTELRKARPDRAKGSLLDDLETHYLPIKKQIGMPTYDARERDLRVMIGMLGPTRRRDQIEPVHILGMLARLKAGGRPRATRTTKDGRTVKAGGRVVKELSDRTVDIYRNAIMSFFTVLGGKRGHNPVKDVERFDQSDEVAPPPNISIELFDRILDAMPDLGAIEPGQRRSEISLTKIRLKVIAFAGLPQKQIMTLQLDKIDWERGRVVIVGRGKGKRIKRRVVEVSTYGMAALRELVDAGACGQEFSVSSMWQSFTRAVAKVAPGSGLNPYSLRHLFGTVTLDASDDLDAVNRLMLHAPGSKATTRIYTAAANARANRRAVDAFDAAVEAGRAAAKAAQAASVGSGGCISKAKTAAKAQ